VEIVLRAFYALHETLRPVLINLVTLSINLALSFALVGPLRQGGLALAISVSVVLEAVALLVLLQTRLPSFDWRGLLATVAKCMLASALMGLALYVFVHSSGAPAAAGARILQLAVALAVGGGVYLAVTALLRVPELSYVRQITRR
jgi:putative peptidoglycan lipid II flippase